MTAATSKVFSNGYGARRNRSALHHRIIDTHNRVHDVVVIGAPIYRSGGDRAAVGMQCSCVDLTAATSPPMPREQPRSTAEYGYTDDEDRRRRIRAATRC